MTFYVPLGKLKEIVKRHQGLIAETEAEATHLVHSAADPLEEEYARPLFRRDRNTLLHWYIRDKVPDL
jgi:SWI/SNF related-matrix-associated actin-dependent regulator of chromatin subfamily C